MSISRHVATDGHDSHGLYGISKDIKSMNPKYKVKLGWRSGAFNVQSADSIRLKKIAKIADAVARQRLVS